MPIYQYVCRKCAHPFEELMFTGDAPPACPECHAGDAERQLSVVARPRGSKSGGNSSGKSCGSCRGGSCGSCG